MGRVCISWKSKKQATVAKSTTEAEYIALSAAVSEGIWLRRVLSELGFSQKRATCIFEDNRGAICLAKNSKHHDRTKHIDVSHHFIREKFQSGEIDLKPIETANQIAYIFTKSLAYPSFSQLRAKLGVNPDALIMGECYKC